LRRWRRTTSGTRLRAWRSVGEIGDRDGVAALRVPPDQVEGEQTVAEERREPGCPKQASNDDVHQSLSRERTNARLVARR